MGLETATWIDELDPTNPTPTDPKSQGDDHLRLTKSVLQNQFPSLGQEAVTSSAEDLNGGLFDARLAGYLDTGLHTEYVADLNDIKINSGYMCVSSCANMPVEVTDGWLFLRTDMLLAGQGGQFLYGQDSGNLGKVWTRIIIGDVWQSWRLISDGGISSGTFIPEFWDNTLGVNQGTYANQIGEYVRQGNVVTISLDIKLASLGSLITNQTCRLGNIPFGIAANWNTALDIPYWDSAQVGFTYLAGYGSADAFTMVKTQGVAGSTIGIVFSEAGATFRMLASSTYKTDDT